MSKILKLIDWYWAYGYQREGLFSLSGGWLDRLYQVNQQASAVQLAKEREKAAFGVWGPSQTGKSTLLSEYLDPEDSADNLSPLSWPGGERVRFSPVPGGSPTSSDEICLNPFNNRSDGSGCVSRFFAAASVADPLAPVECRLTNTTQILQTLARGYLSECKLKETKLGNPIEISPDWVDEKLAELEKRDPKAGPPRRDAYELLHSGLDVVESLVLSGENRYMKLRLSKAVLRARMLEHRQLVSSVKHVEEFLAELFWDNQPAVTKLFKQFQQRLEKISREWGPRRIYCSLQAASMLLDISAHEDFAKGDPRGLRRLSWKLADNTIKLGLGDGQALVPEDVDFAIFQGLIEELRFPVRLEALNTPRKAAFGRFLEHSDYIDFPGVAREEKQTTASQLNLENLGQAFEPRLFTNVVKRGKTSSIVVGYARKLAIHGFLILNKIVDYPSKPQQLLCGIEAWWKAFSPTYSPDEQKPSPLPLNFVLTFTGMLVNDVMYNLNVDKLDQAMSKFHQLGHIANPNVAWQTLATNYERFPDGNLGGKDPTQALKLITEHADFGKLFRQPESVKSFVAAVSPGQNGGTDHLFAVLTDQVKQKCHERYLAELQRTTQGELVALFDQAKPKSGDELAQLRSKRLLEWRSRLQSRIDVGITEEDAAANYDLGENASYTLRVLVDVDEQVLDILPDKTSQLSETLLKTYVGTQFTKWAESRKNPSLLTPRLLEAAGIASAKELSQLLEALTQVLPTQEIVAWLKSNFANATPEKRKNGRRYLALRMSNAIFDNRTPPPPNGSPKNGSPKPGPTAGPYRSVQEVEQFTKRYFPVDNGEHAPEVSPHVAGVIEPWMRRLATLAEMRSAHDRPPQAGDQELLDLAKQK